MVFSLETVLEIKKAATKVLTAVDEKKPAKDIMYAYADLIDMWESPGIVLFRRNYGNAITSMPGNAHMATWTGVLNGINDSRGDIGFVGDKEHRDRLYASLSRFLTGLCTLESCHLDDVNDHYSSRD